MSVGKVPQQDAHANRRCRAQSNSREGGPAERRRTRGRVRRSVFVWRMAVAHRAPCFPPCRGRDLPIVGRGARRSGRRSRASIALAETQEAGEAPAHGTTADECRLRRAAGGGRRTPPSSHRELVHGKTSLANALLPGPVPLSSLPGARVGGQGRVRAGAPSGPLGTRRRGPCGRWPPRAAPDRSRADPRRSQRCRRRRNRRRPHPSRSCEAPDGTR